MRPSRGQKHGMSASPQLTESCPSCGSELPSNARFCPACGATVGEQVLGEAPVQYRVSEPRFFGVAPPHLLLAIAFILFVLALVLFAVGHWPYGLIVLGLAALLLAAFLEAARRRPDRTLGRRTVVARERAHSAVETWRVRSAAATESRRLRQLLTALESDRRHLVYDLGLAVHLGDAEAQAAIRARLMQLDAHEADVLGQLEASAESADERIRQARLPVEETMMVLPAEPFPPPGEATPPQPAVVPEPYPPPDEGNPPEPAVVPEPTPDPGPDR